MIQNKVKLIIWDLDDTFWQGTLGDEGMVANHRNVEIVKELARRGILSSICSKNDFEKARRELVALNVFEYFVFPSIRYDPKGQVVAGIIEAAALRAENVLFLDDNPLNLAEAQFFNPGIMTCHPSDILDNLLEHPSLVGKPDPELKRLNQYRLLQRKFEERQTTSLSNEEFLRASNIRVIVEPSVEEHLDRVIELLNRTNQLNYTKRRLNTEQDIAELRREMETFGFHAGCVFAVDDYGEYGLVGFFLMERRAKFKRLIHFVFSCRTMNMGIEQYIYEMLGKPDIDIAQPVSYGLRTHEQIDWINQGGTSNVVSGKLQRNLVLVGGCDLLQLASYCSANRQEFVSKVEHDIKVRYDDPGFILNDRAAIRNSESIRKIPFWTYEDAINFDAAVRSSQLILISLWPAVTGVYLRTREKLLIHMEKQSYRRIKKKDRGWLRKDAKRFDVDIQERLRLIVESLDAVGRLSPADARVFVLGCHTFCKPGDKSLEPRTAYNAACRSYCGKQLPKFTFVDIDMIVPRESLVDRAHFTREGYFALAKYILETAAKPAIDSCSSLNAA